MQRNTYARPTPGNDRQGRLTDAAGAPRYDTQNSLALGGQGPVLLEDVNLIEKLSHFNRERIPERVVHAKGSGALGHFQLYHSMQEYTSADFLQDPARYTDVLVRFSTVIPFRGSADTVRDPRGFAVKFYTGQGNFDIVGINFPVFFVRDAMKFPDFVHSQKPSPLTNIQDVRRFWDFYSLSPETLHCITWLYSDRGIVKDYRKMDGFGVNTFVWVNREGRRRLVKYHLRGQEGLDSIDRKEGRRLAGVDPDIATRGLYDSIAAGRPAQYELCVQMIDPEQAEALEFDPLDATKLWPEDRFPLLPVGMLVLNRNPENFFAQMEQAAFAPGNLVPGIEFSADRLLQGRTFAYQDTQRHRIGPNFQQLPVNRPLVPVRNNQQDGAMRYEYATSDTNYKPNALNGNQPREAERPGYPGPHYQGRAERAPIAKIDDFSQARLRWQGLAQGEQDRMADAIGYELAQCPAEIANRQLGLFQQVDPDFAQRVYKEIYLFQSGRKS